jgi:hypothetical protein
VFAFAWMFSGWGSFSSRKLLTEKVIIAKLEKDVFRDNIEAYGTTIFRFSMSIGGATT